VFIDKPGADEKKMRGIANKGVFILLFGVTIAGTKESLPGEGYAQNGDMIRKQWVCRNW